MALASPSSAETQQANISKTDAEIPPSTSQDSSLLASDDGSASAGAAIVPLENSTPNLTIPSSSVYPNQGINPTPAALTPPAPPAMPSFTPSFRPLGAPSLPQYSAIPNPSLQNTGIQPPGVSAPPVSVTPMMHGNMYTAPHGQPLASAPLPYGSTVYMSVPAPVPQAIPPPGVPRYPGPYPAMVRPGYPLRPMPPVGVIPQVSRIPMLGMRPLPPMVTPVVRPVVPILPPTEKPQTTVYVGKIAPTVDNDSLLSLLRICGPVKSWKRAQDPSDGKPKGFGFCEFEAAEGVLRALRLLSKLNIDGQELMLNINQATREYLERYVEKKTEREKEKLKEAAGASVEDNEGMASEKIASPKPAVEGTKMETEDTGEKGNQDMQKFGIVTDEDQEADKDALDKITNMLEERLKTNPLPPPPLMPAPTDGPAKSNSEVPSKSKDGDSDVDIMKSEEKNDEETTSENRHIDQDKPELSSPDRRRHDRRSRERDRERDIKREKERELERYERERERERVRRERERELRMREAERLYKERVKDWEAREREKEYQRQYEKDREKDRLRERRKEILRDEEGSDEDDDDSRKRRRRGSILEEKRRKRMKEKEEDFADRLDEEEEIAEAKRQEIEKQKLKQDSEHMICEATKDGQKPFVRDEDIVMEDVAITIQPAEGPGSECASYAGNGVYRSTNSEMTTGLAVLSEMKQNDGPVRKLGFGLAVKVKESIATPNIVAAAEFAKRISTNPKEEKPEPERERNGRSNDRLSRRDRERSDHENVYSRNEMKEKVHDKVIEREEKMKSENRKLLDAKQLIDMIPKTKEELFAYEINWTIYDKHALHERMRPWISKKITEFLGEEEATLVDYIVSSTKEHVKASKMLELLQSILDDEAEMFVLKMWRMLIFEIKKVETGLSVKSKA
ncbi:hypothetical protein HPP92_019185 [Vanilla planifolia]|uniref:RNA-binding protein 25 n=1 Tax=Vanilla planifolia TaxID=51239 RepID=A0A835UP40_VANPL|nr:hypothetical protein HPP92_019185 [Vanilla planifolia]